MGQIFRMREGIAERRYRGHSDTNLQTNQS